MIEAGKIYSYKELCELMDDRPRTGKSKQLQMKDWERYMTWEKPTSRQYMITEVYDIPKEKIDGRINNGGARAGAGSKERLKEEFDYLLNAFLYDARRKNDYYRNTGRMDEVYFNNDVIAKFFGFYRDLYEAGYDEKVDSACFSLIADKIREKIRSWLLNRLKRRADMELGEGIIGYKSEKRVPHFRDELLPKWLDAQSRYLEKQKYRSVRDVVQNGKWTEMTDYITEDINKNSEEKFKVLKKYHKLKFNIESLEKYEYEEYDRCARQMNEEIVKSVYDFFLNKEKEKAMQQAESKRLIEIGAASVMGEDDEEHRQTEVTTGEQDWDIEELLELLERPVEEDVDELLEGFDEENVMKPYQYILARYIKLEDEIS